MTLVLPVFTYRPPTLRLMGLMSWWLPCHRNTYFIRTTGPRVVSTPGNSWWGSAARLPKAWFSYAAYLIELIFRPRCIAWALQMHLGRAPVNLKKHAETVWLGAFLNYSQRWVSRQKVKSSNSLLCVNVRIKRWHIRRDKKTISV